MVPVFAPGRVGPRRGDAAGERRLGHSRRGRDGNDRMSFEEQQPTLIDLVIRRNLVVHRFPSPIPLVTLSLLPANRTVD
jgi:hypothetical protein